MKFRDVIISHLVGQECRALDVIKQSPKYFYSYAKRFSKGKCDVGPLIDIDGSLTNDPKSMTNIHQMQYCDVFIDPDNPRKVLPRHIYHLSHCISDINFTVTDIKEAIDGIRPDAGTSKYEIPASQEI